MNILFICEGNMMRSQMAEAFYNTFTKTNDAISAGAVAESKDHISPRAIEVMDKIGIETRVLKPMQIDETMLDTVDKVVYFPSNYMPDYVTMCEKAEFWDVVDPKYHKEEGMQLVYEVRDEIKQRVQNLIQGSS